MFTESKTITLPKPQVLKPLKTKATQGKYAEDKSEFKEPKESNIISSPVKQSTIQTESIRTKATVQIQTSFEKQLKSTTTQTTIDKEIEQLSQNMTVLQKDYGRKQKELGEALSLIQQRNKENLVLNSEKINLEANVQRLQTNCIQKDKLIETLQFDINDFRTELDSFRNMQIAERNKSNDLEITENKSLLLVLQQLENDKNIITAEYKELLNNEREEYSNTIRDLNVKVMELQSKLDR